MGDKIRVKALEVNGVELEYGTEVDLKASNIEVENIAFQNDDLENTLAELKVGSDAGSAAIYPVTLTYNGTVSNGTFYGHLNTINGLDTPVVVPKSSTLKVLSFSNKNSNADYTLELRKNSSTATPFISIVKVNSQFFTFNALDDPNIEESFAAGDTIFVKHIDQGGNASDVVILLYFKAS